MKHPLLILFVWGTSAVVHGQGQFVFNNRIGTEVNARFVTCFDPLINDYQSDFASPEWRIQLFGGPIGTPPGQLAPLVPFETTFRGPAGSPLAGYVEPITPIVPEVPVGRSANVLVRLVGLDGFSQDFGPYVVDGLGGGTTLPPNLNLGTSPLFLISYSPQCIPEPKILPLGILGMIGLMLGDLWRKSQTVG